MEVANRLMVKGKSASEIEQALYITSLVPPKSVLYKALLAPIVDGQLAAMMLSEFTSRKKYIISDYT